LDRKRLLEIIKKDALMRGDFTLASGKKSTYYINAKKVILKPEGALLSAKIMLALLPQETQAIGGVPLGAVPIVSSMVSLSYLEKKPVEGFLIRKQSKGYGTSKLIEGDVSRGMKVVLVEDVVTTGGSVLKAIDTAREHGLEVLKTISLIDRKEGGAELLQKSGIDFESVFEIDEILG
jgi:orotate phosphoribosyltransferase